MFHHQRLAIWEIMPTSVLHFSLEIMLLHCLAERSKPPTRTQKIMHNEISAGL